MALFKCIQTGNVTEFDLEWDIRTMRQHPDYVEVEEEVKQENIENPVEEEDDVVEFEFKPLEITTLIATLDKLDSMDKFPKPLLELYDKLTTKE